MVGLPSPPRAPRPLAGPRADRRCAAHITDIFSLAATPRAVLSASGSSTLHVHDTSADAFALKQSLPDAHALGCHHICASRSGSVVASAGFGGEVLLWDLDADTGDWRRRAALAAASTKSGEAWALALSDDGRFLACTTSDGRVNVWDVAADEQTKVQAYEAGDDGSGSFAMCVDLSRDAKYTASGHQDGSVYVYDNTTGRILYSLSGEQPVVASASPR